ncbi:MAG: hypothetical protein GTO46_01700 [Gemmatimonadetes bacterium]|nr:hypothetical protein [Gemmatimonadota bacterium]NIO30981.1 hypothetical protein [Gemmatimonadota bacterium]
MRISARLLVTSGLVLLPFGRSAAQEPAWDAVAVVQRAHEKVVELGLLGPDSIWPGFRPDTIPVLYVFPERGTLLMGWRGDLPDGFETLDQLEGAGWQPAAARGAASTGTQLEGRGTAQVVVNEPDTAALVGVTVHEAFHVFQGSVREEGRRFGRGENSFLVTSYPVFDVDNETAFALEGRLLGAALAERSDEEAFALALKFVAAREGRQRRLEAEMVEFEKYAELNEGLAQYAGLRAVMMLAHDPTYASSAAAEVDRMLGDLDGLITDTSRSFRLRFYSTGPAMSLILDRLADFDWKTRMMEENATLQDALAEVVGFWERQRAWQAEAYYDHGEGLTELAERSVDEHRALRRAQMEEALARPGVRLLVQGDALGYIGMCGIDPQNLLQVDEGVLFHTRWFVACAGSELRAEFTTPVVQDQANRRLVAVVGSLGDVKITVGGEPLDFADGRVESASDVRVEAPGVTLHAPLAEVEIEGTVLTIRPLHQ